MESDDRFLQCPWCWCAYHGRIVWPGLGGVPVDVGVSVVRHGFGGIGGTNIIPMEEMPPGSSRLLPAPYIPGALIGTYTAERLRPVCACSERRETEKRHTRMIQPVAGGSPSCVRDPKGLAFAYLSLQRLERHCSSDLGAMMSLEGLCLCESVDGLQY